VLNDLMRNTAKSDEAEKKPVEPDPVNTGEGI